MTIRWVRGIGQTSRWDRRKPSKGGPATPSVCSALAGLGVVGVVQFVQSDTGGDDVAFVLIADQTWFVSLLATTSVSLLEMKILQT